MLAATAVVWAVSIADLIDHHDFDRFGLRPRTVRGLAGVVTAPFLHRNIGHLLSDSLPLLLLGWVVMMAGWRTWAVVTATVLLAGGLVTWAVAPAGLILGASGVVSGWLGYLLARAYFTRRVLWILMAVMVVLVFGSLFSTLLPLTSNSANDPWQGHLASFAVGIAVAAALHPRRGRSRSRQVASSTRARQ